MNKLIVVLGILLPLVSACVNTAEHNSLTSIPKQNEVHFVEFSHGSKITTFDLNTVHMIEPNRFSINSTTIDNPDVVQYKLKVLDALRPYCSRPPGTYPVPAVMPTLGNADLPLENVQVISPITGKQLYWPLPYAKKEGGGGLIIDCQAGSKTEDSLYLENRNRIINGESDQYQFDCSRGMWLTLPMGLEIAKFPLFTVPPNTGVEVLYMRICQAVMHQTPYQPIGQAQ